MALFLYDFEQISQTTELDISLTVFFGAIPSPLSLTAASSLTAVNKNKVLSGKGGTTKSKRTQKSSSFVSRNKTKVKSILVDTAKAKLVSHLETQVTEPHRVFVIARKRKCWEYLAYLLPPFPS